MHSAELCQVHPLPLGVLRLWCPIWQPKLWYKQSEASDRGVWR